MLAQLQQFSITRSAVTANVQAGRWQQVTDRVYATFTGTLTAEARIAAGCVMPGQVRS